MKKILVNLICLFIIGSAVAQNGKLRVAVAFSTDTNFSLLGPFTTKTLEIDLRGNLYKQIDLLTDTANFVLKQIELPEELSGCNNPAYSGIPKLNLLTSWVKGLQKKEPFDLLLLVYKPIQMSGAYASLEGLSYGINTSKGYVFALNNALVFDVKTMKILASTTIDSESDYIAGTFELDKNLPYSNSRNIETPIEMINKLQQDFALKVFQCLQMAKKKSTVK